MRYGDFCGDTVSVVIAFYIQNKVRYGRRYGIVRLNTIPARSSCGDVGDVA